MDDDHDLSFDDFDELHSPPPQVVDFDLIARRMISRRAMLAGSAAASATALIGGNVPGRAASRLDFAAVASNSLDTVTLPEGYSWHAVARWGDPLWSDGAAFDEATRGTGESQERAIGDNNDGMALFTDGRRMLLAVNNEYVNHKILHGNRKSKKAETADDIRKSKAAPRAYRFFEIVEQNGRWSLLKDAPFNRRITAGDADEHHRPGARPPADADRR